MRSALAFTIFLAALGFARPAAAHPAPFTFLDVHLEGRRLDVALVVHIFDAAHDLKVEPMERLLGPAVLAERSQALIDLIASRVKIGASGGPAVKLAWSVVGPLPDRQAVQLQASGELDQDPATLTIDAQLFPYDPAHQTFVNMYEGSTLTLQAMLDARRPGLDYFPGSRQGVLAATARFVAVGARHVFVGPEHLIFLLGALLLGGTTRQLATIIAAFVAAHTLTVTLAAFGVLRPPERFIEPAIALSIIYLGADNLMVRGGRDVRPWIVAAFAAIHGVGLGNALRVMDLSQSSLRWSLVGFTIGIMVTQAIVIAAAGAIFASVRRYSDAMSRRLIYAGSVVVILAGTFWFVQRVFFPGGWT